MTQAERRRYLIGRLLDERGARAALPRDAGEQRRLLRGLLNERAPGAADAEFLAVQDDYLRQRIAEEGITDVRELTPASGDLYLWQGDITRLRCGAIVNAANSALTGCYIPCHGCIDNCIHTFAGVQLRADCAALMAAQGHAEPTGQAKITRAYNLPCDHVIHTVGPIVTGGVTAEDERLLTSCYRACLTLAEENGVEIDCVAWRGTAECLTLAEENGVESLAFCCISTGVFHFPNERAAALAVDAVRRWKAETGSAMKVIFNVFKDKDYAIYEKLLH